MLANLAFPLVMMLSQSSRAFCMLLQSRAWRHDQTELGKNSGLTVSTPVTKHTSDTAENLPPQNYPCYSAPQTLPGAPPPHANSLAQAPQPFYSVQPQAVCPRSPQEPHRQAEALRTVLDRHLFLFLSSLNSKCVIRRPRQGQTTRSQRCPQPLHLGCCILNMVSAQPSHPATPWHGTPLREKNTGAGSTSDSLWGPRSSNNIQLIISTNHLWHCLSSTLVASLSSTGTESISSPAHSGRPGKLLTPRTRSSLGPGVAEKENTSEHPACRQLLRNVAGSSDAPKYQQTHGERGKQRGSPQSLGGHLGPRLSFSHAIRQRSRKGGWNWQVC